MGDSEFYSSLFSFQLLTGNYQNVIIHPGYCSAGCCAIRAKLHLETLQQQKLFVYILLAESFWVFLVSILKPETLISKSNLQVLKQI